MAAQNGHLEVVRTLVEQGASVNATNYRGNSPVTMAAKNKHWMVVSYLMENGAVDPDVLVV